jgi:glycosyltransferase involved in cell wall biosynthesis
MTLVVDDPNIIYHGPMREIDLLNFMKQCDFAIMPHIHDEHSGFMNPMKVNMYQQIGLPCVASSMPGVDFSKDGLFEAISSDDFITIVGEIAKIDSFKPYIKTKFNCEKVGNEYILELSKAEF